MTANQSAGDAFERALDFVLRHEGGFADHPEDPGGATNFGITLATYRGWARRNGLPEPGVDDLKSIPEIHVFDIYRHGYWRACHGPDLPVHLAFAVFDMAVNAGPARAVRLLQQALDVTVDGLVGGQTLAAAMARADDPTCFDDYTARRLAYYGRLSTFPTFGLGWSRRAVACHREAEALAPWRDGERVGARDGATGPVRRARAAPQHPTPSITSSSLWRRLWNSWI